MIIHIAKWKLPNAIIGETVKLNLRTDTDKEFKCLVADITEDEVLVIPREPVISLEEYQEIIIKQNQNGFMSESDIRFLNIWERADGSLMIEKENEE